MVEEKKPNDPASDGGDGGGGGESAGADGKESSDDDLIKNPYGQAPALAETNNTDAETSPTAETVSTEDEQLSSSPSPGRHSIATSPTIPESPPDSPGTAIYPIFLLYTLIVNN